MSDAQTPAERVLVLMANAKDAERTVEVLAFAGLQGIACADRSHLCREIAIGAGTVLLSEEVIVGDREGLLAAALRAQPAWSSVPVVAVVREGAAASRRDSLLSDVAANVTLIERPVRMRTLVSVVRGALRARLHQYQVRDAMAERELALDAARLGWWRYDPSSGIVTHDLRYGEIYGLAGRVQAVEELTRLLHPEDVARVWIAVEAALNPHDPQPYAVEYRVNRPDGSLRWVEARGLAAFDGEGAARRAVSFVGTVADVTERRRTEEQLRRNHDTFYHLIQNNPFGIYVVDADFRLREVSRGAMQVFRGVRPLLGRDFAEVLRTIWIEPFASEAIALFKHTLETGESYSAPTTTERRQDVDAVESYDWQIERVVLPDGRFGVVCYFYDLTHLQKVQAALRTSEQRFKAAVAATSDILWTNDAHGRMTRDQPAWGEFTGQTPDEYEGLGWGDAVHPDDTESTIAAWNKAVADCTTFIHEHRLRRRDGVYRIFSIRAVPLINLDGSIREWVGTHTDITDRKLVEAGLRESEHRFRAMADASPAMLWLTDPSGNCTFLSRRWYEFTGQTEEQALGLGWTQATHPDDRAEAGRLFVKASNTRTEFRTEYRLRGHDGSYRWSIDVGRPWFDASGEYLGMVGVVFDIDDRKRAEDGLREADRRKDEFLATLGHELRNPLAPIRNGLGVLRLSGLPEGADQVLSIMDRQLVQLVGLVDDLLDVARVTSGKIALRQQTLELREAVEAAIETSRPSLECGNHKLDVRFADQPLPVYGDRTRLSQVVTNVLHNACKYTPDGGRIELITGRDDGEAVVRISDNGIGIPADMLPRVFETFTQVGRALDRSQGGLGLGLALVRTLVERHGGSVSAESPGPGGGSTFTIRLPIAEIEPKTEPIISATDSLPVRRVLVVDDLQPAADLLAMMLKRLGQETRAVYDGSAAIKATAEFRPHVLISDIGMREMDGYELARRIRSMFTPCPVLIALTGYGQVDDQRQAFDAGFDYHLVKPSGVDAIRQLLLSLPTSAQDSVSPRT